MFSGVRCSGSIGMDVFLQYATGVGFWVDLCIAMAFVCILLHNTAPIQLIHGESTTAERHRPTPFAWFTPYATIPVCNCCAQLLNVGFGHYCWFSRTV